MRCGLGELTISLLHFMLAKVKDSGLERGLNGEVTERAVVSWGGVSTGMDCLASISVS